MITALVTALVVILVGNLLVLSVIGSIKVSYMVADKFSKEEFSTKHELIYMFTLTNLIIISVLIISSMLYLISG